MKSCLRPLTLFRQKQLYLRVVFACPRLELILSIISLRSSTLISFSVRSIFLRPGLVVAEFHCVPIVDDFEHSFL